MALVIRLRQQGRTNRQSYRLVVANKRSPRDGKYLEKLGWYDPFAKEEKSLHVEENKLFYWLDKGAARFKMVKQFSGNSIQCNMDCKTCNKCSDNKFSGKLIEVLAH